MLGVRFVEPSVAGAPRPIAVASSRSIPTGFRVSSQEREASVVGRQRDGRHASQRWASTSAPGRRRERDAAHGERAVPAERYPTCTVRAKTATKTSGAAARTMPPTAAAARTPASRTTSRGEDDSRARPARTTKHRHRARVCGSHDARRWRVVARRADQPLNQYTQREAALSTSTSRRSDARAAPTATRDRARVRRRPPHESDREHGARRRARRRSCAPGRADPRSSRPDTGVAEPRRDRQQRERLSLAGGLVGPPSNSPVPARLTQRTRPRRAARRSRRREQDGQRSPAVRERARRGASSGSASSPVTFVPTTSATASATQHEVGARAPERRVRGDAARKPATTRSF